MTLFEDCKHEKLKMFPDYSSGGLWCARCGCEVVNPEVVPFDILKLLEGWVVWWEYLVEDKEESIHATEYVKSLFNDNGARLAKMVNAYIPCEYVEDGLEG